MVALFIWCNSLRMSGGCGHSGRSFVEPRVRGLGTFFSLVPNSTGEQLQVYTHVVSKTCSFEFVILIACNSFCVSMLMFVMSLMLKLEMCCCNAQRLVDHV